MSRPFLLTEDIRWFSYSISKQLALLGKSFSTCPCSIKIRNISWLELGPSWVLTDRWCFHIEDPFQVFVLYDPFSLAYYIVQSLIKFNQVKCIFLVNLLSSLDLLSSSPFFFLRVIPNESSSLSLNV